MGKVCNTAIGAGIAGAIVGVCAYSFMSPRDQKHIQNWPESHKEPQYQNAAVCLFSTAAFLRLVCLHR